MFLNILHRSAITPTSAITLVVMKTGSILEKTLIIVVVYFVIHYFYDRGCQVSSKAYSSHSNIVLYLFMWMWMNSLYIFNTE